MKSIDGLNGLQMRGGCPVKYKEDECLTSRRNQRDITDNFPH